jgi:hypothetical protein|mmetsp:Transcript_14109/g.29832  ORF Transcript_14109/g.29832 Transcript_14109/m.29832 type:complete len:318 (-) Transcript_14109:279-1232(-)|eukprot:CAMPEP_0168190698 /NCGR_PEP_ID=MMETSP0139_2-20121125/17052_1 /TAXON_ID=44445 /ORGANISM="Pseudo-nitzschia australis, Strain 10249 10 AB" /LENGTH=317 /DNA_ID=CAMNT_0008113685 /DNA_START=148 /DNA_END=1101 /DNA_ORIENTATION=+
MADSSFTDTHKTTKKKTGSKMGRSKIGMFFNNSPLRKDSSSDEIVQKLLQENRQLRQDLSNANNRISKLEEAVAAAAAVATTKESQERELSPTVRMSMPMSMSMSMPLGYHQATGIREAVDYRDDNSYAYSEDTEYEADDFSIEVEASAVESGIRQQREEDEPLDIAEVESTTASACTIPTGNNKKSNSRRRQLHLHHILRGSGTRTRNTIDKNDDRSSPPIESITQSKEERQRLLGIYGFDDSISITSDLSSSVSSLKTAEDDNSRSSLIPGVDSLMSGRMLPLYAMRSLLRISSTDSDFISGVIADDESSLFGEI